MNCAGGYGATCHHSVGKRCMLSEKESIRGGVCVCLCHQGAVE